jgi:hypothetical protein
VLRLAFDVVYLPIQASKGHHVEVKRNSGKIVEMTSNENLYFYGDGILFADIIEYIFYIESGRGKTLRKTQTLQRGDYYIAKDDFQENANAEKVFSFRYKNSAYGLFKK